MKCAYGDMHNTLYTVCLSHHNFYSTLYDFESLRATVKSCLPGNNQKMLSFETFLKQSSRNVVVVYVMASSNSFFKSTFLNTTQKSLNLIQVLSQHRNY